MQQYSTVAGIISSKEYSNNERLLTQIKEQKGCYLTFLNNKLLFVLKQKPLKGSIQTVENELTLIIGDERNGTVEAS